MIDHIQTDSDRIVGMRVTGKITSSDVDAAVAMLDERLERYDGVSLVVVIDGLEGVSAAALMKDISYGLQQLPHLSRFHRVAVVTDRKWIRAAIKVEGKVLPGVQMKAFRAADEGAALAWVRAEAGVEVE